MSEKIKRFFECLIPVTSCNLKCEYCYVIQQERRHEKLPVMNYSPEQIGKALTQERLGGTCYISICGAGETLLPGETFKIVRELLSNGHFVNITTNGTLTHRLKDFLELPAEYRERLHFAFSLHYIELKKRNLIEVFFENVKLVKNAGCSFLVQLNMYDGYMPYVDEIRRVCLENVGAYPQIAATRDTTDSGTITLLTSHTKEQYKRIGEVFQSPLYEFTLKNFMVRRHEFCYAGSWSGTLNLSTGILKPCYSSKKQQNIFDNIEESIDFDRPIGNSCCALYCTNSSHFLSLGVIPSMMTPSYAELRNREEAGWYSQRMKEFLEGKLYDNNPEYTEEEKAAFNKANRRSVLSKLRSRMRFLVPHKMRKRLKKLIGQ